ncbi:hypothetical protein [Pelotomaculum propionicicum]|uniref:hypothetical protein n=1 Tax=Pelotomaculum propionicicum TaxID=258475 RepID=UPI003BA2433F
MSEKEIAMKAITGRYRRDIRNNNDLRDNYDPFRFPIRRKKELGAMGIEAEIKRFPKNTTPCICYRQ